MVSTPSASLFHIFRNSPTGRENLLQSLYFCRKLGNLSLTVYQPESTQGLMYFEQGVVTIDLDNSYVRYRESSQQRLDEILAASGVDHQVFIPQEFTASTLPNLPVHWAAMACPRVISEQSGRIGLGHVGPKVRAIVKYASFPVFLPCACYKPWTSVSAMFGGSPLGLRAVRLAARLAGLAGVPLTIYTQADGVDRRSCADMLAEAGIRLNSGEGSAEWVVFESGSLEDNLYAVPYDSLVVLGACARNLVHELVFGSTLELVQATLPNPLCVVGPHCRSMP